MAQHFNIAGELTQELLAPGSNVSVSRVSLTNTQKVSKCKVDLYIERTSTFAPSTNESANSTTGKFYFLKQVELPIGATLIYDNIRFSNASNGFGLYIKLTDGATFTLTGSINPSASATLSSDETSGTAFLSEVSVGDEIVVSSETRTVNKLSGDDGLVVTAAFTDTANDTTPDCNPTALVDVILG